MDAEAILLKVPKWVSDSWTKAGPNAEVGDLDLDSGTLTLNAAEGKGTSFQVIRHSSPDLFAFSQAKNGTIIIEGAIGESLQSRVNLEEASYRRMLQQRAEDRSIVNTHRSEHMGKVQATDYKPMPTKGDNFRPSESAFDTEHPPSSAEVTLAIEKALKESKGGLTYEELLTHLDSGCSLISLRNALVAAAECVSENGKRLYTCGPHLRGDDGVSGLNGHSVSHHGVRGGDTSGTPQMAHTPKSSSNGPSGSSATGRQATAPRLKRKRAVQ